MIWLEIAPTLGHPGTLLLLTLALLCAVAGIGFFAGAASLALMTNYLRGDELRACVIWFIAIGIVLFAGAVYLMRLL